MDPFSIFAWIAFYMVIVVLFYWCFRKSVSAVANTSPGDDSHSRTSPAHSATNNHQHRLNERRMAYTAGAGRNVYLIREENQPPNTSDHSFHPSVHPRSPPEYKWEDLPPSYEEAIGSFTNPTFTSPSTDEQPSTRAVNDAVIELPATAASVN